MVNSIVPGGVSGLGAPHHEPRLHRANVHQGERRSDAPAADDSVELSAASLAATRESVVAARGQLGQVLSLAQDARATLVGIQALLSGGGSQIQLEALLAGVVAAGRAGYMARDGGAAFRAALEGGCLPAFCALAHALAALGLSALRIGHESVGVGV